MNKELAAQWVRTMDTGLYAYERQVSDRVKVVRTRAYELDGLWIVTVHLDGRVLWHAHYGHLVPDPSNDSGYIRGRAAIAYGNVLARALRDNLVEIESLRLGKK